MKYSAKSILRSTSLLFLIPTLTSACALDLTPPQPIPAAGSFCEVAKPIFYDSKVDRPATVEQIEAHNKRFVCLCENDCPKQTN